MRLAQRLAGASRRRPQPLCGQVAAMVSIDDLADRAPRALADGEALSLGRHEVRWLDAPHVPHGWECGFLMERRTAHAVLRRPVHAAAATATCR